MAHFCFSYRGPLNSEEFVPLVKGFTFIYREKRRKSSIFLPLRTASVGKKIDIPDRLQPSTGYLQLIGMPTWHIGPLGSEEFDHKLKGFTFIYIEKRREEKAPFLHPFEQPLWGKNRYPR